MKTKLVLLIAFVTMLLSACGPSTLSRYQVQMDPEGTTWTAVVAYSCDWRPTANDPFPQMRVTCKVPGGIFGAKVHYSGVYGLENLGAIPTAQP